MPLLNYPALMIYRKLEDRFPNVWRLADEVRAKFTKGSHLDGSIFSVAEATLVTKKICTDQDEFIDPALVGALVAWRPTKGIFKFNTSLFESLIDTDIKGEIPSNILLRMPSWAVYIETPQTEYMPYPVAGFWAFLSRQGKQNELILVAHFREGEQADELKIDCENDVMSFHLPIGNHPVSDLIQMMFRESKLELDQDSLDIFTGFISNMLTLLLYLCSEEPDINDFKPATPTIKYFGKNPRLISSKEPMVWDVGIRIGAALDFSRTEDSSLRNTNESNMPVRPHIRRAHWHSFWVGKKGEQTIRLKWLPPIAVNAKDNDPLPAVIREVLPVKESTQNA